MPSSSFDHHKAGSKTFTTEEVERSRMLRQARYNHLDPTLQNERQRCKRALGRYNRARDSDSGNTESEVSAMLEKVIDPSKDTGHHFLAPCKEKGFVGGGVRIESPFKCTYGYNLRILDDVYIGENVTIDDASIVEIGSRTWIGDNVTILTSDVIKDMVDRKGTGAAWICKSVVIAPEVIIGTGAKIFPGVRLERGATVEPFAVVRHNIGENLVVAAHEGQRYTL
jgi:acetyltransferase-like isoleucine patch superfamily enzyme